MSQLPQKQDAQFSQQFPQYSNHDDEISLVDLAKTLVKRWRLMVLVSAFIMLAGLAYALTRPTQYDYTTIYSSAELDVGLPLESTESVQSKINSVYIPEQVRALQQREQLAALPFKVAVSSPKGTNLIELTSKAMEEDKSLVNALHNGIINQLTTEQDNQINKRLTSLQQRLDAAKQQLAFIQDSNTNKAGEMSASVMERMSELESQMNALHKGSLISQASQSLTAKGTSKSLIMALALVLSGMLAVIAVFLTEFAAQVRKSLD